MSKKMLKIITQEDMKVDLNTQSDEKPLEYDSEKPRIIRVIEAIKEDYDFRNNTIRQVIEFKKKTENKWKDFEEEDINTMWIDFQLNSEFSGKEKPTIPLIDKLLKSRFTNKYNPIENFFKSLKWDGKDHIYNLAKTVTIKDINILDDKLGMYWYPLFKRWLISATSCGLGYTQNHVMLLLIGGQGTGKTTFLDKLAPKALYDYLYTGHINPELDKTTADLLAEKFIINIDDQLQSIFNKDFHKIKGLITATSVTNRKAFRRDEKKRDRIANFVGSVNKDKIFEDVENRRYLTFEIDKIDYQAKIDINQVWAQAYHLLTQEKQRPWFDGIEKDWINAINAHFAQVSQEEEWLIKMYRSVKPENPKASYVMFSEILTKLNKASGLKLRDSRLQIAMKRLRWHDTISKRINGSPRYVYAVVENFILDQYGNVEMVEHEEDLWSEEK